MERFLIVYRGAHGGTPAAADHDPARWAAWRAALGGALLDRGSLSHNSVEVSSRLLGPKLSGSSLAGYALIAATDFNAAVRIAEDCPIFDQHGWVEVARLADCLA
nr:hypothetical protein [uncultured Duganella sp.]